MVPQLPRAPAGEIVALDGAFFNRLMDIIAALSNLTVTPPLTMNDGPAGRTISLTQSTSGTWIVLTGAATKSATYTANLFGPSLVSGFDPTASGTVAQSDVGAAGSTTVYAVNVREIGKSTHDLDTGGTFLPMLFWGTYIGSTSAGSAVYRFDGLQWENCS